MRRRGTALVEFALVAPLLLLLLAGVLNYGQALRTATSVATAARSGAQFGSKNFAAAADTNGIRSAAVNSAPDIRNLTVTSQRTCQCSGGGAVSCSGSCPGANMEVYVQVTAQAVSSSIFSYSGLPFSGNTSSQATMRIQ